MWCQIIDSGQKDAFSPMQRDAFLLKNEQQQAVAVLHLYEWGPIRLTYGYFTPIEDSFSPALFSQLPDALVRRPTGGGILFHGCDFAFSLFLPASSPLFSSSLKENYQMMQQFVIRALEEWNPAFSLTFPVRSSLRSEHSSLCMANTMAFDLLLEGKKVSGIAQKKTKAGILYQQSLFLFPHQLDWIKPYYLGEVDSLLETLQENSTSFFPHYDEKEYRAHRAALKQCLVHTFLSWIKTTSQKAPSKVI